MHVYGRSWNPIVHQRDQNVSKTSCSIRPIVLSQPLCEEIAHWLFPKSWSVCLPWRSERHHQFQIYTDASSFAWGGVLYPQASPIISSDYWTLNLISSDIAVKEALALANTLSAFADSIRNSRVDVFVDNSGLIYAWNKQGARSHAFSDALKEIFKVLLSTNCVLRLTYLPSTANIADYSSWLLSLADAGFSYDIWMHLQTAFGGSLGHLIHLTALPSNAMTDLSGNVLPFFAPYHTPCCSGVNIFNQMPCQYPPQLFNNPYVFQPICLIPHVLRFLRSTVASFTIVIPDIQPRRFWWPICFLPFTFLSAKGPQIATLDFVFHISEVHTPTFLYFDLYHCATFSIVALHKNNITCTIMWITWLADV